MFYLLIWSPDVVLPLPCGCSDLWSQKQELTGSSLMLRYSVLEPHELNFKLFLAFKLINIQNSVLRSLFKLFWMINLGPVCWLCFLYTCVSVNTHASQRECQPSCSTGMKKDKGCCYVSFSRWTKELQRTVSAFTCKTCNNVNVVGVLRYVEILNTLFS